jgi:hypothetical protein
MKKIKYILSNRKSSALQFNKTLQFNKSESCILGSLREM